MSEKELLLQSTALVLETNPHLKVKYFIYVYPIAKATGRCITHNYIIALAVIKLFFLNHLSLARPKRRGSGKVYALPVLVASGLVSTAQRQMLIK